MKLVLVVFHVLSVNLTPTSRINTVSEYCDCNKEVANKFENLNKVGSRGKCMEDLRDVFWSMFEDWGFGSSKTSDKECALFDTDPLPCDTLKSCSAVRCQV